MVDGPPQVRGSESESELDINIRVALAAAGDTDTVVINVRLTRNERKEVRIDMVESLLAEGTLAAEEVGSNAAKLWSLLLLLLLSLGGVGVLET